jgi:hypothetical protein
MSIDFAEQTIQAPWERHGTTGSAAATEPFELADYFSTDMTRLTALSEVALFS